MSTLQPPLTPQEPKLVQVNLPKAATALSVVGTLLGALLVGLSLAYSLGEARTKNSNELNEHGRRLVLVEAGLAGFLKLPSEVEELRRRLDDAEGKLKTQQDKTDTWWRTTWPEHVKSLENAVSTTRAQERSTRTCEERLNKLENLHIQRLR